MMVNSMLDDVKNKIENDKEILSVLPKNNLKNRKNYLEKVTSLINEYQGINDNVLTEIEKRYHSLCDIKDDNISNNTTELLNDFNYLNSLTSPMEILNLDKMLDIINSYENENLDIINENILNIIKVFNDVGIVLNKESFDFNVYASEYIDFLLKEKDNNKIHEYFEKLYWKCPNILKYLVVNFYDLYFKNNKKFISYIENQKSNKFSKYEDKKNSGFSIFRKKSSNYLDNVNKEYQKRIINYDNLISKSRKRYLDMFLNNELDIKDYDKVKIDKMINDYTENSIVNDKKSLFINLRNSLREYQMISKYHYIIDECHELYNNKNDYKSVLKNKLKDIDKISNEIKKNNVKAKKIMDNDNNEFLNKNDLLLNDLLNLYSEYDLDIIKDRIYNYIDDNSKLSLYLELGISSYLFLKRVSSKYQIEMDLNDILKDINTFIHSPYVTLINNEGYSDLEKLNSIVVDKYKLLGFNINLDYLEEGNIDNFIKVIDNIVNYHYMNDININFDDISFILKAREILEGK